MIKAKELGIKILEATSASNLEYQVQRFLNNYPSVTILDISIQTAISQSGTFSTNTIHTALIKFTEEKQNKD